MNKQLVEFYVAGMKYYKGVMYTVDINEGDYIELSLEPENKFDKYAVTIIWNDHMMGYVPKTLSKIISTLIQNGIKLDAKVIKVDPCAESYEILKVEISLAET